MKAKTIIFTGMALGMLGLAAPSQARADYPPYTQNNPQSNHETVPTPPPDNAGAMGSSLAGQDTSTAGEYSPPPNQPPPPIDRAGKLIGMKVKNPAHQTLGKVKDVVFDLQTGRISYVVLEKAGRTHGTGKYAAVPPTAFTPSSNMKYLILNTDKTKLQTSQGFSRNNYPPVGQPAYGAEPARERQQIIIVPIVPATPDQNQTPPMPPDQDKDQDPGSGHDQGQHPMPWPDLKP